MSEPMDRINIQLHIDRLVLDGLHLSLRERQQLQSSIESELGRLLSERGLHNGLTQSLAIPKLTATSIQLDTGTQQLGQQIAASVYGGIGHGPTKP